MKIQHASAAFALSVAALSGCSEDAPSLSMDSPYGGEIKLERIVFTRGELPPTTNINAFFIKDQQPDNFPMPKPGTCFSPLTTEYWPVTQADGRAYIDVGNVTISGGPNPLELPPAPDGFDVLNRTHGVFYGHFMHNADDYLVGDRRYTVTLNGSAEYPETVFEDAIYVPPELIAVEPPPEADAAVLTLGEDFTAAVDLSGELPPDVELFTYIMFSFPEGGPALFCLDDMPTDGSITVPASVVETLPPSGMLLRAQYTHKIAELDDADGVSGRRIDLMGANCVATPFVVRDAAEVSP